MWTTTTYKPDWRSLIGGRIALTQHRVSDVGYSTSYAIGSADEVKLHFCSHNVGAKLVSADEVRRDQYDEKLGGVYTATSGKAVVVVDALPVHDLDEVKQLLISARELAKLNPLQLIKERVALLRPYLGMGFQYVLALGHMRVDFNVSIREWTETYAACFIGGGDPEEFKAWANSQGFQVKIDLEQGVVVARIPTMPTEHYQWWINEFHRDLNVMVREREDLRIPNFPSWEEADTLRHLLYKRLQSLPRGKAAKLQAAWDKAEDAGGIGNVVSALGDALLRSYFQGSDYAALKKAYAWKGLSLPEILAVEDVRYVAVAPAPVSVPASSNVGDTCRANASSRASLPARIR